MSEALSIRNKQKRIKDSKNVLAWADLDSKDKKLILVVCLSDSIEDARKNLKLSTHGFYSRWQYLKPMFNSLLDNFPWEAQNILKIGSKIAAKTLVNNLQAKDPADQIKSANSILDRTIPKEPVQTGLKRKLTLEEFSDREFPLN